MDVQAGCGEAVGGQALERTLNLPRLDVVLLGFVLCPLPGLPGRRARYRTALAVPVAGVQNLLAAQKLV